MLLLLLFTIIVAVRGEETCQREGELVLVQVLFRHGTKTPDVIDPFTTDFWDDLGYGGTGILTKEGEMQIAALGKLLRDRYVINEPLLTEVYNQHHLFARGTVLRDIEDPTPGGQRVLVSMEALTSTLYPGANVAIWHEPRGSDILLQDGALCPSFNVEYPRLRQELNTQFRQQYGDILDTIANVTGWASAGIEKDEISYITDVNENVAVQYAHGYPVHPYLAETFYLTNALTALHFYTQYSPTSADDPRGAGSGNLARKLVENMQKAISGDSRFRMYAYGAHSTTVQSLYVQLGLGVRYAPMGGAFVLELRRDADGYFVQAEFLQLPLSGYEYKSETQYLNCPVPSGQCSHGDFVSYLQKRNPVQAPDSGCCFRGRGFYKLRCDDYLNPATAEIPQCATYRTWCPQNSCGQNQVVDRATNVCVQLQAS